jgi:hypothetical protein
VVDIIIIDAVLSIVACETLDSIIIIIIDDDSIISKRG